MSKVNMKTDINTAPEGTELLVPGVAVKETRNGKRNYFVRCPGTGEYLFRHQIAFDQLLKRFDNDLARIGTEVYSRAGKLNLEKDDPELFAKLFPKKTTKKSKPKKEKKESPTISKAKKALAEVVPDMNPYDDEEPVDMVDVVDVDENVPVEALEVEEEFPEDDYEDIYNEIDSRNLETEVVE